MSSKPDITLVRELLGWEPKIHIAEGSARTTEYFRTLRRDMPVRSAIWLLVLLLFSPLTGRGVVAWVPDWLPEDCRFAVDGDSNEVVCVNWVLDNMRERIHPQLWKAMKQMDASEKSGSVTAESRAYPAALGPTLQWLVHATMPSATNEAAFFDSFRSPVPAADMISNFNLLTNRASRLSYLPATVRLSLVFRDDGRPGSVVRAVPGVDYPGVEAEDSGSTDKRIRIVLRAPKHGRRFNVLAEADSYWGGEVEFKWIAPKSGVACETWKKTRPTCRSEQMCINVSQRRFQMAPSEVVAVFARERGGFWGVPSFVELSGIQDYVAKFKYGVGAVLESIDYGDFVDVYRTDEKGRTLGFTRMLPGMVRGDEYSNEGELMVESYSEDRPKTTRRVKYRVENGRLRYEVLPELTRHKNAPIEFRSEKW